MSHVKTDKLSARTASGTITLGESGETLIVPSGVVLTNNGTASGFGGVNTPAFYVQNTGSVSITNQVYTKITFNDVVFDTDSGYDNVTNHRYTVPTGKGGKYLIGASLTLSSTDKVYGAAVGIQKNGSYVSNLRLDQGSTANGVRTGIHDSRVFELSAGDYLEIYGFVWGPGTLTCNDSPTFFGFKLVE